MIGNVKYYWLLFIVWPFLSFILALRRGFNKRFQWIILAFSFLYGYTVFVDSGDIVRYKQSFYVISDYSWSDYFERINNLYTDFDDLDLEYAVAAAKPDLYAVTLQFVTSRFTDNPRWFWGLTSVVYTLLFLQMLNAAYSLLGKHKFDFVYYILLLSLILLIPFYRGVTGVRFYTAFFLFISQIILFLSTFRKKHIFYASLSVLIHYTFIFPFIITLPFLFFRSRITKLLIPISLFIFLVTSVSSYFDAFEQALSFFDETAIQSSAEGYASYEGFQKARMSGPGTNWYVEFNYYSFPFMMILFYLLEFFLILKVRDTQESLRFRPLLDVFLVLSLLSYNLSLALFRFSHIFLVLLLLRYLIIYTHSRDARLKYVSIALAPLLFIKVLVTFRAGFYTVDPLLLVNNVMTSFLVFSDVSLSEWLVGH